MTTNNSATVSLPGSKPPAQARKGLVNNADVPVKQQVVSQNIGSVIVVEMVAGERFFGIVTNKEADRGCMGNTRLTLTVRDGSERVISWREGLVASVRAATLSEVLSGMAGL